MPRVVINNLPPAENAEIDAAAAQFGATPSLGTASDVLRFSMRAGADDPRLTNAAKFVLGHSEDIPSALMRTASAVEQRKDELLLSTDLDFGYESDASSLAEDTLS